VIDKYRIIKQLKTFAIGIHGRGLFSSAIIYALRAIRIIGMYLILGVF